MTYFNIFINFSSLKRRSKAKHSFRKNIERNKQFNFIEENRIENRFLKS
jgi:hypothetical protein